MTTDRRTMIVLTAAAMVLMLGLVGTASAALVATDVNTGGADTGFSEGWDGSSNIFIATVADLTYANYGITQTGTTQGVYSGNTNHLDRMDSRNLAAAMSGDIWFSALVNVPTGTNFAGLAFDSDPEVGSKPVESYSHQLSELRVVLDTSQLVVDMDGGAPPTATGTETGTFAADTTHLILGNMNVGAGNDTLSVWVDPDVNATLPVANFTSTTVDFMDSVVRIGVPASGASGAFIDAIRLSDTATAFQDVTGVEPGGGGELKGELGILDLEANGGINPATGSEWQAGDQYRLVFVTSETTQATSGDITTYDAFVQGLADTANLGGTWKVLGSTSAVDAKDHTSSNEASDPSTISVIEIDGSTVVANNYADLWDGGVDSAINTDELGNTGIGSLAFTGNDRYGVGYGTHDLGDSTVGKGYIGLTDWRHFGAGNWGGNNVDVPPSVGWLPNTQERRVYVMSDPLTVTGGGAAAVPEPSTFVLAALGLWGLGWYGRRRRRRAA